MGTRPVTLCTAQWADVPFDELCVLAKKMGYDGLEVACWGEGIDIDKALTDDSYVAWIKENLEKNGLVMKAMACHIIGQCVGDLPDPRLDNFAPPALAGQPEAIQKWAVETMKKAPAAAAKFGVKIITGFTGSPIWRYLYSFPQTPESMVEEGFDKIAYLFEAVGKIEKEHEERYLKLLDNLTSGKVFERSEQQAWVCANCGHIHYGNKAPEKCPVCDHPMAYFKIKAENY